MTLCPVLAEVFSIFCVVLMRCLDCLLLMALFKFLVRIPVLFQGETADSVSYHLKETEYAFIPGRVCAPSSARVII